MNGIIGYIYFYGYILELRYVQLDERFFDVLKSFTKMKLLVLSGKKNFEIRPSFGWPSNLKNLTLEDFQIPFNTLISIIKKLPLLENIDVEQCDIPEDEVEYVEEEFEDVKDEQDVAEEQHVENEQDFEDDRYLSMWNIGNLSPHIIEAMALHGTQQVLNVILPYEVNGDEDTSKVKYEWDI